MHIRQVALVARELDSVVADLSTVFDLEISFRDPGVAAFGLHNAVMPVGQSFLEVVSPVRASTTAGRFLDRLGGDGGYMVIVQTADLAADRRRLAALGVRIVWEIALDDIATIHLHPRDVGGAILSLDEPHPPAGWRWGGPAWQTRVRTEVVHAITGVTLTAADPARMAARWAEVLGLPAPRITSPPRSASASERQQGLEVGLDPGAIRFVGADGRSEAITTVRLASTNADRALSAARARNLRTVEQSVWIGGVRFDLA